MKINELKVGKLYICDMYSVFNDIYKIDKNGMLKVRDINDNDDCFEESVSGYNEVLRGNFEEYIPKVDWSKVKVDTKVYVRDFKSDNWTPRYFAKYKDGNFHTWVNGATSWSTSGHTTAWNYYKLAEESEDK